MVRSILLAASFPPALGGVETLLYQTARRLSDPPLVFAPASATPPDMVVTRVAPSLTARAAYRPLWRLHPTLWYALVYLRPTLRAIRAWRPRVLQAGHVYLAPITRLLAQRARLPYVVYAYGQEVWRGGHPMGLPSLDTRLRGVALREANAVLSPGSFTTSLLTKDWCVDPSHIHAIPYGAEPRPDAPSSSENANTLLSVARLVPRKGIDIILRALPDLPHAVTYRVVGRGPDEQRLRALARDLHLEDRVTFLGRLDDADLEREYQRATLFVLPARRTAEGDLEGYGLVYFEAAAWGRPVIAGRSGGEIDAVVNGETGILVDGESVVQAKNAIADLLADPRRLAALGSAGRLRVESTHNWSAAARAVDAVLESLA